mmetsp:Transcript_9938/g.60693  ORF Transcript_9938/g.60693 Transcript_9938/m.60693 type:complete len:220 (+) Transcript_9938:2362-3021(+)
MDSLCSAARSKQRRAPILSPWPYFSIPSATSCVPSTLARVANRRKPRLHDLFDTSTRLPRYFRLARTSRLHVKRVARCAIACRTNCVDWNRMSTGTFLVTGPPPCTKGWTETNWMDKSMSMQCSSMVATLVCGGLFDLQFNWEGGGERAGGGESDPVSPSGGIPQLDGNVVQCNLRPGAHGIQKRIKMRPRSTRCAGRWQCMPRNRHEMTARVSGDPPS